MDGGLEARKLALRDGVNLFEVLEVALLGLFDEEVDEDEGDDVEAGEEAEGAAAAALVDVLVAHAAEVGVDEGVEPGEEAGEEEVNHDGDGAALCSGPKLVCGSWPCTEQTIFFFGRMKEEIEGEAYMFSVAKREAVGGNLISGTFLAWKSLSRVWTTYASDARVNGTGPMAGL